MPFSNRKPTKKKKPKTRKRSSDSFGREIAERPYIVKLASATDISPDMIRHLSGMVDLPVISFVKHAFADPNGFTDFLALASGATKTAAPGSSGLLMRLLEQLKRVPKPARMGGAIAGGAAAGVLGARSMPQSMSLPGLPEIPEALASPKVPEAPRGSTTTAPRPAPSGMSPATKNLLVAGGVGASAIGAGLAARSLFGGRKKRKETTKESGEAAMKPITKKRKMVPSTCKSGAERLVAYLANRVESQRLEKRAQFSNYLSKMAADMPFGQQAPLRQMQAALANGASLGTAIKVACPQLTGEERGVLAAGLVRGATKYANMAGNGQAQTSPSAAIRTASPMSQTVSAAGGTGNAMNTMRSSVGF